MVSTFLLTGGREQNFWREPTSGREVAQAVSEGGFVGLYYFYIVLMGHELVQAFEFLFYVVDTKIVQRAIFSLAGLIDFFDRLQGNRLVCWAD